MNNFLTTKDYKLKTNNGFTIVEIIIAISITALAILSIMALYSISLKAIAQNQNRVKALNLATENIEITKAVRDESWSNISNLTMGNNYHLAKTGNPEKWIFTAGEEQLDIFNRKIIFENALRDANDNIVASGGTNDPNTKKVTSIVSWQGKNITLTTYIANWK